MLGESSFQGFLFGAGLRPSTVSPTQPSFLGSARQSSDLDPPPYRGRQPVLPKHAPPSRALLRTRTELSIANKCKEVNQRAMELLWHYHTAVK